MQPIMNKLIILLAFLFFGNYCFAIVQDEIMDELLKDINPAKPLTNLNYNYENFNGIPIQLKITEKITTKKDGIYDNQPLTFKVKQNVTYKGKVILRQGSIVNAAVDSYLSRGMNGIPAAIVIDNYHIAGIDSAKIKGFYKKRGLNLSLMVFPIKWALTPIPGVGSLTNFILGGNASITPNDTIIIYYYPDWGKIEESSPID